jgi:hypothetical protein
MKRKAETQEPIVESKETSPKKKTPKKDRLYKETLEKLLGNVYTQSHSYRRPDVVQVVGWTRNAESSSAKTRYILVRPVKFVSNPDADSRHGGNGHIDASDVLPKDDLKPVSKGYDKYVLKDYQRTIYTGESDENGDYPTVTDYHLRKRQKDGLVNEFYLEDNLERDYMWCCY